MTDLSIQDFNDLSSEKRAQFLLNEHSKMFGEQELHLNKKADPRLFLSSLARLIIKVIRDKEKRNAAK